MAPGHGSKCKVEGCNNTTNDTRLSFFSFPIETDRKLDWAHRLGVDPSTIKTKRSSICEKHFELNQFASINRTRLKKAAVPKRIIVPHPHPLPTSAIPQINPIIRIFTTTTTTATATNATPAAIQTQGSSNSNNSNKFPFLLPKTLIAEPAPQNNLPKMQLQFGSSSSSLVQDDDISYSNKCLICHKDCQQANQLHNKSSISTYIKGLLDLILQNTKLVNPSWSDNYKEGILYELQQCAYCEGCIDEMKSIYCILQQVAQLNQILTMKKEKITAHIKSVIRTPAPNPIININNSKMKVMGMDRRPDLKSRVAEQSLIGRTDRLRQTLIKHLEEECTSEAPKNSFIVVNSVSNQNHPVTVAAQAQIPQVQLQVPSNSNSSKHRLIQQATAATAPTAAITNEIKRYSIPVRVSTAGREKRTIEQHSTKPPIIPGLANKPPAATAKDVVVKIEKDSTTLRTENEPTEDDGDDDSFINYQPVGDNDDQEIEIKTEPISASEQSDPLSIGDDDDNSCDEHDDDDHEDVKSEPMSGTGSGSDDEEMDHEFNLKRKHPKQSPFTKIQASTHAAFLCSKCDQVFLRKCIFDAHFDQCHVGSGSNDPQKIQKQPG